MDTNDKKSDIRKLISKLELNTYDIKDYLEVIIKACKNDENYQLATAMELASQEHLKAINLIEKLKADY